RRQHGPGKAGVAVEPVRPAGLDCFQSAQVRRLEGLLRARPPLQNRRLPQRRRPALRRQGGRSRHADRTRPVAKRHRRPPQSLAKRLTHMSKPDDYEAREFHVETKFQQFAKRPGGVPRDQAIINAQSTVATLKPGFETWLDDEITHLLKAIPQAGADLKERAWMKTADAHS